MTDWNAFYSDFYPIKSPFITGATGNGSNTTSQTIDANGQVVGGSAAGIISGVNKIMSGLGFNTAGGGASPFAPTAADPTTGAPVAGTTNPGADLLGISAQDWIARVAIILLGMIFVAAGLTLFGRGAINA